jgi:hypothetical protein
MPWNETMRFFCLDSWYFVQRFIAASRAFSRRMLNARKNIKWLTCLKFYRSAVFFSHLACIFTWWGTAAAAGLLKMLMVTLVQAYSTCRQSSAAPTSRVWRARLPGRVSVRERLSYYEIENLREQFLFCFACVKLTIWCIYILPWYETWVIIFPSLDYIPSSEWVIGWPLMVMELFFIETTNIPKRWPQVSRN